MKAIYTKIFSDGDDRFFAAKSVDVPFFSTEFHFHEECQLVYTMQSEGRRMIGDSIEDYCSGELILVGANVPMYGIAEKRQRHKIRQPTPNHWLFTCMVRV